MRVSPSFTFDSIAPEILFAVLAFAMTVPALGEAQTVTKNFEAVIPNIPGKSLIAVEVEYAPGAASPSHTHAKSAFIYAYVGLDLHGRSPSA